MDGNLLATGSSRTLRVAAAVAAALEEAAHSGVKLEFFAADWLDGNPPPLPAPNGAPPSGTAPHPTAAPGKAALLSKPVSARIRFGQDPLWVTVPPPQNRPFVLLPEPGTTVFPGVEASGARFTAGFDIGIPRPSKFLLPADAVNGSTPPITHHLSCRNGQWHRLDLPPHPGTPRPAIFVRASSTTMPED